MQLEAENGFDVVKTLHAGLHDTKERAQALIGLVAQEPLLPSRVPYARLESMGLVQVGQHALWAIPI